jgi:hypothetical protein
MLQPLLKRRFEERRPNRWGNPLLRHSSLLVLLLDISLVNPTTDCYDNDYDDADDDIFDGNWFGGRWSCKNGTFVPIPVENLCEEVGYA